MKNILEPGAKRAVFYLLSFLLFCFNTASAQPTLEIDGTVKEGRIRLPGAAVTLLKNGVQQDRIVTTQSGKFAFEMPLGPDYMLVFSKKGYVTKKINFITKEIPDDKAKFGFTYSGFEVGLFKEAYGLDVSILQKPIGKIAYDPKLDNFEHDKEYTKSIQAELAKLQKALEQKQREEAEKLAQLELLYKTAIANGNREFTARQYENAKPYYMEASKIKPDAQYPKSRLKEIDKLLAELLENDQAAKALQEKYNALIAKADKSLSGKQYELAKTDYVGASKLKPQEQYPKTKIAECDKLIAELVSQKELDAKYNALIAKADNGFNAKNYAISKTDYQSASNLKPSEQYPKDRISKIEKILADEAAQKEKDEKYATLISKADQSFSAKQYEIAKKTYQSALGVKPDEQYPKDKVAEIDKLLAEIDVDNSYKSLIAKADNAFSAKKYKEAKADYNAASKVKSAEQYPKDKIAEIDKLLKEMAAALADQKAKDDQYNLLISRADNAFGAKDYEDALSDYQSASSLKPAEQYPKDKIREIKKILESLATAAASAKARDEQYNSSIANADKAFNAKKYSDAMSDYQSASAVKPEEKYPKGRIAEIKKILADLAAAKKAEDDERLAIEAANKSKQEQYDVLITQADRKFDTKYYEKAKADYQGALTIIPDEAYPKQRIEEIDNFLAGIAKNDADAKEAAEAKAALRSAYTKALAKADFYFKSKDYDNAKIKYKTASGILPDEQYPKDQLAKIDEIQSGLDEKALIEKQYKTFIISANKKFKTSDYENAKTDYLASLEIKPNAEYPKRKIKEIEMALKDRETKAKIEAERKKKLAALEKQKEEMRKIAEKLKNQKNETETTTTPDIQKFVTELAQKYPEGITESTHTEGSATILKRIVVKGNTGAEYKRVTHNWGGRFFFKNGSPITQLIWDKETSPEQFQE